MVLVTDVIVTEVMVRVYKRCDRTVAQNFSEIA